MSNNETLVLGAIALTEDETTLLQDVMMDANMHGPAIWQRQREVVGALMASLSERQAIPEHRVQYFSDGRFNPGGRGSSIRDEFAGNGTSGEAIYGHPHFVKYLRYFLFGTNLSDTIKSRFADAVEACGGITSGDIRPLSSLAKELAKRSGLPPKEASDEFYKLALDCGVGPETATSFRDAVRSIR